MPPAKVSKLGGLTIVQTQVSEESLPLGGADPRRLDALGFRARAHALAAARIKDPVLVGFEVRPVAPDGRVDLTAAKEGEAEYTFRTRAVGGAECPVATVKVTPKAVVVSVSRGESLCKEAPRAAWRCSLAAAWQLARRQGAKPIPAKVSWLADGWFFDFDDAGSESVRDTCR
jgi:hypothetical protein